MPLKHVKYFLDIAKIYLLRGPFSSLGTRLTFDNLSEKAARVEDKNAAKTRKIFLRQCQNIPAQMPVFVARYASYIHKFI